jgi:hypothetical protein
VSGVPREARDVLRRGVLCYLGVRAFPGLHLTPVVFVLDGDRVWGTTARGTVKARSWARDPTAAGMVRHGDRAVTFRGRVTLYDALDPSTWPSAILRGPAVARASTRFTMKNARFFAGYARDAYRVPLSWTPPGRVFFSIDLQAGAVLDLDGGNVERRWGSLGGGSVASVGRYRDLTAGPSPERRVPADLRRELGGSGQGALGLDGGSGPAVLPCRWARVRGAHVAVVPRRFLDLAGPDRRTAAALVVDRTSVWRAAKMRGVMLRGQAEVFLPGRVRTGREALLARARRTGTLPEDPAVVRLRAEDAVWWRGWASGTVGRRS